MGYPRRAVLPHPSGVLGWSAVGRRSGTFIGKNGSVSTQLWACRELPAVVGERNSEGVDGRVWTEVTMTVDNRVHATSSVEEGAAPWAACGTDRTLGPPFGDWGDRLAGEDVYCAECLLIHPIG